MKNILLLIFFLLQLSAFAAREDSVIASAGHLTITESEFKELFEHQPQINREAVYNLERKKKDFLYSLIAEKLMAMEAESIGLDKEELNETAYPLIEKLILRDALYKEEVLNKISITEDELKEGMMRLFTDLKVSSIFSPDSTVIFSVYKSLNEGKPFDSLYYLQPVQLPQQIIEFDHVQEEIEDKLYSLSEGEFTAPVKNSSGWIIFKLDEKIERSYTSSDINSSLKKTDGILKERKEVNLIKDYLNSFLKNKKIETSGDLFWSLTEKLTVIFKIKKEEKNIPDTSKILISNEDYNYLRNSFGEDSLSLPFVLFDEEPLLLKDILKELIFEGFFVFEPEQGLVAAALNNRIRRIIENELLFREAKAGGFYNRPEVQKEINRWKSHYLYGLMRNSFADSVTVTEEEVKQLYNELNKKGSVLQKQVNIIEILTDSLEVIEESFKRLEEGEDFINLASIYTKREWTKESGGEFGLFPVTMYGEIGRIAGELEIGEIYGPLKVPEGYSLFKLIDKHEPDTVENISFNEVKNHLKKGIANRKIYDKLNKYTAHLAEKYNVKINETLLEKSAAEDFQMITLKSYGFGGRLTAVPLTFFLSEWYNEYLQNQKDNP